MKCQDTVFWVQLCNVWIENFCLSWAPPDPQVVQRGDSACPQFIRCFGHRLTWYSVENVNGVFKRLHPQSQWEGGIAHHAAHHIHKGTVAPFSYSVLLRFARHRILGDYSIFLQEPWKGSWYLTIWSMPTVVLPPRSDRTILILLSC